jgi:hypothetical protein
MVITDLTNAVSRLGISGMFRLTLRKIDRSLNYKRMLRSVLQNDMVVVLKDRLIGTPIAELQKDWEAILHRADAMLRDDNIFFTFPYRIHGIDRPWEFDPIESKHWPHRHYTERQLHAQDTPRDVKIVFEINRFKDLPALGQAAFLTREAKYADEVERRLLSWIDENPFANSVNWSSALEISIRLISWTTTLLLLNEAGFQVSKNPKIQRSIYEQISYLAADLGTDKVVSTNHLIGEAAGLFVVASLWEFKDNKRFARLAHEILEQEIVKQTFEDGVTQEASSWYHQFVTHFFDLADRVASSHNNPFSSQYKTRLSKMKAFLESMTIDSAVVRYGDSDDGWALFLEGDIEVWKDHIFGFASPKEISPLHYYPNAKVATAYLNDAFLFLRAGTFGMGGAGFSSHAHDDFLSPIIYLAGIPVLVDPGTFVYSGDSEKRAQYRIAIAHNGLILGNSSTAIPRKQFGWQTVRPDAIIHEASSNVSEITVTASYGEWSQHQRKITVNPISALIEDQFLQSIHQQCEWRLHLSPEWEIENGSSNPLSSNEYHFRTNSGDKLTIRLHGNFETTTIESYDYSPSYLVAQSGTMLRMTTSSPAGAYAIQLSIDRNK